jgi:hypothetical protein
MATGILGQSAPTANTNTTVYTVPASTTATFSVSICNTGTTVVTARLAIAASGTPGASEWLEYGAEIAGGGVLERTGIVAQATKRVVAYVSAATAAVSVFGFEEV